MCAMTSRERVMCALNFKPVDRVPKDLGGMASTGVSAFAYPKLVEKLGLPKRRCRVHDTSSMLAMPDMDVLDALGCDVVTIWGCVTNAFDEPDKWEDYDFNGRLSARVCDRSIFKDHPDGTITQPQNSSMMPPSSTVFDVAHGGNPLDLSAELPKPDLKQVKADLDKYFPTDEYIQKLVSHCKNVRNSTDKAIFLNGVISISISICIPGGLAVWPMICMTEPNFVQDYHALITEGAIKVIDAVLPEIAGSVDIIMLAADDWGTQQNLIASPVVFKDLYLPFYKQVNKCIHQHAPELKTFLHSCGAVYDIIDMIIESGFDILNPIQWSAGKESYKQWKDKCRNRIAMWGGGVNSQVTLPLGSVEDVANESKEVVAYFKQDSGYVFNSIHNITAEIEAEKVIAMYRAACQTG